MSDHGKTPQRGVSEESPHDWKSGSLATIWDMGEAQRICGFFRIDSTKISSLRSSFVMKAFSLEFQIAFAILLKANFFVVMKNHHTVIRAHAR